MLMKWEFLAIFLTVLALLSAGFVSAQTLNFDKTIVSTGTDPGLPGYIKIVKIGGYSSNNWQYFYLETKEAGIAEPPANTSTEVTISVEADISGHDIVQYIYIYLTWIDNKNNISFLGYYKVGGVNDDNAALHSYNQKDIGVSGNRITVKIPAMVLQNANVLNVEFDTMYDNYESGYLQHSDSATYYADTGSQGNTGNGEENENTSQNNELSNLIDFGSIIAVSLCILLPVIIWLLVSVWVYKDAKKKCNDHPLLWFFVVLLLTLIGLIIYLVAVKNECDNNQYGPGGYYKAPPPPPE